MDGICYEDLTLSGADRYDVWRERYSMEWFDKNILYVIQMSSNSGFDLNEGAMSNTLVPPSVKKLELKAQGQNGSYMDFNVEIENTPCRYESAVFLIGIELAREDFEAYGKSPVLNLEIVADRAEEKPLSFPPEAANRPDSHPIVLAERFSYQPVWVPFYNGAAFQDSNISIIRDYDGLSYYLKGGGAARSFYEMDASIYGLPTLREQLEKYSPAWFEDRVLLLAITYTNSESRLPTWKKPLEKGTPPPSVVTHVYLQDGMLYVAAGNPPTEEECYHMPGYYFVFIELERDMLFADPSTVSRLISAELTRPWEKELSHTALKTKVDPASSQSRKELVPLSIEGSAILWLKSVRTIEEQGVKRLNAYVKVGPDFYGYSHSIKGLEPFYQAVTEDGPYEVVFDPDYVKYVDGETARELLDAPSISYALLYRVFGGEIPVKEVRPAPADVNPYLADTYSVRRAGEEMVTTTVAARLSGIFTAKVTDIRYDARGFLYAVTLDDGNRSYSIRIHEQVATGLSVGQTYRFNLSTDRLSFVAPSLIGKSLRLDQVENEIDWDDMTFRPATKAEQAAMTCDLTFLKPTASHAYRQEAISRIDLPSYAGAMKLKSGQREGNPVSPVVLVLYEELLAMVEELRVEYDTSATHEKMPQIPSLDTLLTRYDEEWFRTHDLILFSPGFCSSNDSKMVFYGPDETVSFPFRQSLSRQGDQLRIFQDLGYHEGGAYCLLYEVEKSAGITSARVIYDLCWPE